MTRSKFPMWTFAVLSLVTILFLAGAMSAAGADPSASDSRAESRAGPAFQIFILPQNATQVINDTTHAAFFGFQIVNRGDQAGDVFMEVDGAPEGWSFVGFPGGTEMTIGQVAVDDPRDVNHKVAVPAFEKAGEYPLEIQVSPADNVNFKIAITAIVNQFGGVDLVAPPDVETDPGQALSLTFIIHNLGNGPDTYTLYRVDLSGAGWLFTIGNGNTTGTVKAQLQTQKVITVTVPFTADATLPGKCGVSLSVSVRSNFNDNVVDGVSMCIKVRQQWDISFIPDEGTDKQTGPDEQVDFPFTLSNDGNGFDIIAITVESTLDGWQIYLTQDEYNLTRDTRRPVILSVVPTPTTTKGEYFLTLSAISSGPPEAPLEVVHNIKVVVTQKFDFSIEINKNTTEPLPLVPPGGVGEYTLTVTNEGNGPDTIDLDILNTPEGWFTTFDQEEVSVLPGKPKDVVLTVQVSNKHEEAVARLYQLSLEAISDGNKSQVWTQNISVEVAPKYQISFTVDGQDTVLANPFERANYNHIFALENLGNTADDVQLLIDSVSWGPEIGITPSLATVNKEIGAFASTKVQLTINVPTDTPVDTYSIDVTAVSQNDPSQRITQTVHLSIVQKDVQVQPIRFKLDTESEASYTEWSTYLVKQGSKVQMRMVVLNNGTEEIFNVNVKVFADNKVIHEENVSTLSVLETHEVTVQFDATFLGPHRITVNVDVPGDVSKGDNSAAAVIDVREEVRTADAGTGQELFRPGSPLFLVLLLVVIVLIIGVVKVVGGLSRRSSRKEVYDTIYGDQASAYEQTGTDQQQPPPPGV